MQTETVKIVREDSTKGYKIINKSDFNPEIHILFGDDAGPAEVDMTDDELRAALEEAGVKVSKSRRRGWMLARYADLLDAE